MTSHTDFYEDPERGAIPQWPNRFAVMAWPSWLTFVPIAVAPRVSAPTVVVHSEDGAVPAGAHRFLDSIGGDGTAVWTDGTQFDFYDQPAKVGEAADAATAHFDRHLR